MPRRSRGLAPILWLVLSGPAWAGMPSITLSDIARARVQSISFFLLVFVLCALAIQFIWNRLRSDFSNLPRLSFFKALGVMALWGSLFVLVLTMISGARELMTPGAWKKDGLTYTPADAPGASDSPASDFREAERQLALERLRVLLWSYAEAHDGRFPVDQDDAAIPESAWRVPDSSGMRYLYLNDQRIDAGQGHPLAFEPGLFDAPRFVLLTNGAIQAMPADQIARELKARASQ